MKILQAFGLIGLDTQCNDVDTLLNLLSRNI